MCVLLQSNRIKEHRDGELQNDFQVCEQETVKPMSKKERVLSGKMSSFLDMCPWNTHLEM
jgi:hypothetical protein